MTRQRSRVGAGRAVVPVALLLVLTGVVLVVLRPVSDPSPWLHLRVGELLAHGGRFGLPDPLSPAAGRAYPPTQWLPSVVAYELVARVGLPAVAWLRVVAVLGLLVSLCLVTRRRLGAVPGMTLAVLVTLLCLPTMTERPQAVGMVLLALTLYGWWGSLEDGRPRWWLLPLAWVFASSHGLWSIGLLVGAVVCLGRVLDGRTARATLRLALLLALQVAATALTPLGPALLATPFTVGANGRAFVQEWQPGTLASPTVLGVVALAATVVVLTFARHGRLALSRLLVVAAALVLTAAALRTGGPGAILLTPVVAEVVAQRVRPCSRLPLTPLLVTAALAALVAVPLADDRAQRPVGVPTGLTSALTGLPPGSVLLSQSEVSGWVLWTAPRVEQVVDVRVEAYTPQQMGDFVTTYQARPGWQPLLDRSRATHALVPADAPLVGALEEVRHWRVVGSDSGFVLLAGPGR